MLEHLNFFNKVITELLAIDVNIDEKDKILILLSSLPQSYNYITIMLYANKTLILKEVLLTLLSKSSRKCQIKRSRKDRVWWS